MSRVFRESQGSGPPFVRAPSIDTEFFLERQIDPVLHEHFKRRCAAIDGTVSPVSANSRIFNGKITFGVNSRTRFRAMGTVFINQRLLPV